MNNKLLVGIFIIIILGIGFLIINVQAQVIGRISPRCGATTIDVDYVYKVHPETTSTNYEVILVAGRCQAKFRGTVQRTTNLGPAIAADINNEIVTRNLTFYPNAFNDNEVDGRGSFSIP